MNRLVNWFLNSWLRLYEQGLYAGNPCDAWASDWLKPVGKFLTALGSECQCCSGARVLCALIAGLVVGGLL
jgi:hypothetical protein